MPDAPAQPQIYVKDAIIEYSYGYEQTNIEFYKILSRSKQFVMLQKMTSRDVPTPDAPAMTGRVEPAELDPQAKPFRRKVHVNRENGQEIGIAVESYGWATLWDGMPAHFTAYH